MATVRLLISILLTALIVLVGLALIMGLILAWSLGWGVLLRNWLSLTLFEGAVLILGASYLAFQVGSFVLGRFVDNDMSLSTSDFDDDEDEFDDDDEYDEDDEQLSYPILAKRFTSAPNGGTWEAWTRYIIANNICLALTAEPEVAGYLNERQKQEVSIRLADVVVSVLQHVKSSSSQPRITITGLKHQMDSMNLQPYEDELLLTTVRVVNMGLRAEPHLKQVVRDKLWSEPCDRPGWRSS